MMGAIENKKRDDEVYLTYDEKVVRRATIDRAVQILGRMSYQTYDEQAISRIEIALAIRAATRRRRLTLLCRTVAIVLGAVLGSILMLWIGSTGVHRGRTASTYGGRHVGSVLASTSGGTIFHDPGVFPVLIIAIPLLLLVGVIVWGTRRTTS